MPYEVLWCNFRISRVRTTSLIAIRGIMTGLQDLTDLKTGLMHIRGIMTELKDLNGSKYKYHACTGNFYGTS